MTADRHSGGFCTTACPPGCTRYRDTLPSETTAPTDRDQATRDRLARVLWGCSFDGLVGYQQDQVDRVAELARKAAAEALEAATTVHGQIEAWIDEAPSGTAGLDLLRQIIAPRTERATS